MMIHPDDIRTLETLRAIAAAAAGRFALPLKVVEHKRRPHPGGHEGVCYYWEGRVSVVIRFREGSRWWPRPIPTSRVVDTLAHELAHLRHADHGRDFKALEAEIRDFCVAWRE